MTPQNNRKLSKNQASNTSSRPSMKSIISLKRHSNISSTTSKKDIKSKDVCKKLTAEKSRNHND